MRRLEDQMPGICHHDRLGLRRCSPEHIDDRPVLFLHRLNDRVRELLPSVIFVGIGLMRPDGQHSVEDFLSENEEICKRVEELVNAEIA